MAKCDFNRRYVTCQQFSFGPLQWRSISWQEAEESDSNGEEPSHTFGVRLLALIERALAEGCTAHELHNILRKHIPGDCNGDA